MSQETVLLPLLLLLLVYLIKRLLLKAKVFDAAATAYHVYSGLKKAHPTARVSHQKMLWNNSPVTTKREPKRTRVSKNAELFKFIFFFKKGFHLQGEGGGGTVVHSFPLPSLLGLSSTYSSTRPSLIRKRIWIDLKIIPAPGPLRIRERFLK